jgi:hypothetical protein
MGHRTCQKEKEKKMIEIMLSFLLFVVIIVLLIKVIDSILKYWSGY